MKYNDPIPVVAGAVDGWRFMMLKERGEPLVAIGAGSEYDDLMTSAIYAGEHAHSPYRSENAIAAANSVVYVRKSVAERLRHAQAMLPGGMKLIVFDGYRSVAVQKALYDQFLNELRRLKPDWSDEQLADETERYVSLPSTNVVCPSPHLTGGAVDVAVMQDGRMIEFGTPFDHGTERSALRYFENDGHVKTEADVIAKTHRRLLYSVMHDAGFEGFEHEWWHYNAPETQMGAHTGSGECASFGNGTLLILTDTYSPDKKRQTIGDEPVAPIDRIAPSN